MVNTIPKGNSGDFVKQLELVLEVNEDKRLIILYLDNAKWRKTNRVKGRVNGNPMLRIEY